MATTNTDERNMAAVAEGGQIHEDLMDKLWDISPEDLPFQDMCGEATSEAHQRSFVEEQLEEADPNNAKVDGADVTGNDSQLGQRKSNFHQTSTKIVQVSDRARNVRGVGAADELVKQVTKRQRALRRDVEARLTYNKPAIAGDGDTIASECAGIGGWVGSSDPSANNTSRGITTGADPVLSSATGGYPDTGAVGGTKRAMSETVLKTLLRAVYTQGGNTRYAMGKPEVIEIMSDWMFSTSARVATMQTDVPQSNREGVTGGNGTAGGGVVAQGAVNIYVSNFGSVIFVPNRFQPDSIDGGGAAMVGQSDLFLIDPELWDVSYLQKYRTEPLSKTGLSAKRLISVDYTLCAYAERGNAAYADIDHAEAMVA